MPFVKQLVANYRKVQVDGSYMGMGVRDSHQAANLAFELIGKASQEQFLVLYFNSKNKLQAFNIVGIGGVAHCPVSVAEIFKHALLSNSSYLIVCHNHPSDETTPSQEDLALTNRICEVAELMDIVILDHIIIGEGFYSFAEHKLIKRGRNESR